MSWLAVGIIIIAIILTIYFLPVIRYKLRNRYLDTRAVYPALFADVEKNLSDLKHEISRYLHAR